MYKRQQQPWRHAQLARGELVEVEARPRHPHVEAVRRRLGRRARHLAPRVEDVPKLAARARRFGRAATAAAAAVGAAATAAAIAASAAVVAAVPAAAFATADRSEPSGFRAAH